MLFAVNADDTIKAPAYKNWEKTDTHDGGFMQVETRCSDGKNGKPVSLRDEHFTHKDPASGRRFRVMVIYNRKHKPWLLFFSIEVNSDTEEAYLFERRQKNWQFILDLKKMNPADDDEFFDRTYHLCRPD